MIASELNLGSGTNSVDSSTISTLQELNESVTDIEAVGRLVGDFTDLNTINKTKIKSGDKIFIPTVPNSITMTGEIMTPGSVIWQRNENVEFYIDSAAGLTEMADKRRIYIIYPNGKAEKQSGFWKSNKGILPGSTIVVPRKVDFSSTLEKISSVTSVFYQLTLTLAGLQNLLED